MKLRYDSVRSTYYSLKTNTRKSSGTRATSSDQTPRASAASSHSLSLFFVQNTSSSSFRAFVSFLLFSKGLHHRVEKKLELSFRHLKRRPTNGGGRAMRWIANALYPPFWGRTLMKIARHASSLVVFIKRPSARRGPGDDSVDRNVRSKCRCSCVLQFTS